MPQKLGNDYTYFHLLFVDRIRLSLVKGISIKVRETALELINIVRIKNFATI